MLGPLEQIDPADPAAIVIGRHGLVVEQGCASRTAAAAGRDRSGAGIARQFLAHTCRKAGLPIGAWRRGAQVFRFDADVFGD